MFGSGQKSKTRAIVMAMEEYLRCQQMQALLALLALLALRGKVQIEYGWEREEALELKANEGREWYLFQA